MVVQRAVALRAERRHAAGIGRRQAGIDRRAQRGRGGGGERDVGRKGEQDVEGAADPDGAVDLYRALVARDDAVHHREAEAGAVIFLLGGEERLEDALAHLRGHAGAGVAHLEAGVGPARIDPARVEEAKQLDAGARHILERTDFLERIQGENVPPNFLILARRWGLLPEPKMDPLPLPRILQDIDDSREMLKELERLIPQTKSMETTLTHDAQATLAILDGLRAPFEELRLSLKQLDPDELGCTLPDQIDAAPLPEQSGNPAQRVVDWARDTQAMLAKVKDFYGASSAHWHLATVLDSEVADAMRDCNVQVLANAQGAEGFHAFAAPFVDAASAAHPMTRAVLLRPPKPSSTYRP